MNREIKIAIAGADPRAESLLDALRRGRPSTRFVPVDADTGAQADWVMTLEPQIAENAFHIMAYMRGGVPAITVEGEATDLLVDDSCAVIFGHNPTDEEFVRGMLPYFDSEVRYSALCEGARAKSGAIMDCDTPKVSVVVVTFNQEATIARTLKSILGQCGTVTFEVIIGEDGSTDATRAVCRDFAARYPHKVRLMPEAPNKGMVDNYFDCFEAARGEYMADCAGDDYWVSSVRLLRQVEYLEANPRDASVIGDWLIIEGYNSVHSGLIAGYSQYRCRLDGCDLLRKSLNTSGFFPLLSAMLWRREALARINAADRAMLRNPAWGCEDVPVLAALGSAGGMGYLPLTAVAYVKTSQSITDAGDLGRTFDFYIKPVWGVIELARYYGVDYSDVAQGLDARLRYLGYLALRASTPERVAKYEELCANWPLKLSVKGRVYRAALGSRLLTNMLKWLLRAVNGK